MTIADLFCAHQYCVGKVMALEHFKKEAKIGGEIRTPDQLERLKQQIGAEINSWHLRIRGIDEQLDAAILALDNKATAISPVTVPPNQMVPLQ